MSEKENKEKNSSSGGLLSKIINIVALIYTFFIKRIEYKTKKSDFISKQKKELEKKINENNKAIEEGDTDYMAKKIKEFWNIPKRK